MIYTSKHEYFITKSRCEPRGGGGGNGEDGGAGGNPGSAGAGPNAGKGIGHFFCIILISLKTNDFSCIIESVCHACDGSY